MGEKAFQRFLNLKEVAKQLRVPIKTLHAWTSQRQWPRAKWGKRTLLRKVAPQKVRRWKRG